MEGIDADMDLRFDAYKSRLQELFRKQLDGDP
jgi:hypothetical protein